MFAPTCARLSLVGAVLLFSPSLFAARLAVLAPKVDADSPVSEGRRNKMHDALAQGLSDVAGADFTVLSGEEVRQRLSGSADVLNCQKGGCIAQASSQLQLDRVIVAQITMKTAVGGSAYQIRLTAIDPTGKQGEISYAGRCGDEGEGCNLTRAFESMRKTSMELLPKLKPAATPPVEVAKTEPVAQPVPTSASSPEGTLKDPSSSPMQTTTAPAVSTSQPATPHTRNTGYRIGWIASGIVAGGLLITSIPFLILSPRDGQPTCTDRPSNQCPTRYQGNLATGLGLLGGGVAAATAFGVLYYLDRRDLKRSQGQVAVLPFYFESGSGLAAVGRF